MKTTILVVLGFIVCGAAWGSGAKADEVAMSAEAAYTKAVEILLDMGAVPALRDKELLMIKTEPLPMKMTMEEADCGSMFGIAYLRDKRVKVAATYLVRCKRLDEGRSDVSIKITLDGYMDVNEGAPFFIEKTRDTTKVLTCKSKGLLEKRFMEALMKE